MSIALFVDSYLACDVTSIALEASDAEAVGSPRKKAERNLESSCPAHIELKRALGEPCQESGRWLDYYYWPSVRATRYKCSHRYLE